MGVAGVGVGLPTVGLTGALHGEARDIDDPLSSLPQQCQQKRCATSWLIDGPEDLSSEAEDLVDELEKISFVVFDSVGEELSPRVVESMRPMELLAHIDTDPDSGDTVYQLRDLHFFSMAYIRPPVEDPADGSLRSEYSPISISGQSLHGDRGAIPIEPSSGRGFKAILGPLGVIQISIQTTQTMVGRIHG